MSTIETLQMNMRFDGFRSTPFLWEGSLEGLEMISMENTSMNDYPKIDTTSHIRLGKLIEQFVLFELEKMKTIQLLKANIQVFRDQVTLGELDCIIRQLEENIHLEIIYKFYLYDPTISGELNRWVGPNKNDSLVQKFDKLKHKQLPLLHSQQTVKILKELGIDKNEIKQKVYFKAQLFVPLNMRGSTFDLLKNDCIKGFYLHFKEINSFADHTFYVPSKLDWLIDPYSNVEWISFHVFQNTLSELLASKRSPLCWMRSPEGKLQKIFVVWWD